MNEATRPLPEAIDDEYGMDPPIHVRWRYTIGPFFQRMRRVQFVEPIMLLTTLMASIVGTIQTNAVELQYCKAVLGIDDSSICLNTTGSSFVEVQKYASSFQLYSTTYNSVFPIIFSLFVGPWSDTFGRRPVMLLGSVGILFTSVLWVWGSTTYLHPNYFILFGLPSSLCGGTIMMITSMFCYVCDITPLNKRAQRLGILQGFIYLGSLVGTFATPYLIKIGYTFTFTVGAVLCVIRLLYVVFILKESVDTSEAEQASVSRNPFRWCYVKSLYETCYVKQPPHTFRMIMYTALLALISLLQVFGEMDVFYLFLQKVLGWALTEYTVLNCVSIIACVYSAFLGTWFVSTFLGLADMQIINIVNGLRLLGALTLAFGRHIWLVYVAVILNSAVGMSAGMIRVFLSRIIDSDDLGKVFALFGTLDLVTPILGSLLYNSTYNATINSYPNAVFLVSAFLCLLLTLLTAKIVSLHLRSPNGSGLTSATASINN